MADLSFYIAAFVFVIALIVLGAWLWRSMLEKGMSMPGNSLFKGSKERRIGAIETASIDNRRKLILIRRDGVEHLIMTGGPVDVVIETGISPHADKQAGASSSQPANNFDRSQLENNLFNTKRSDANLSYLSDD